MNLNFELKQPWCDLLASEFEKPYYAQLQNYVDQQYEQHEVYPPRSQVFEALNRTMPDQVKVVILGQDPYHGPMQAHGLSFSVPDGVRFPPSLVNIFKALERDLSIQPPFSGDLSRWADQGVLLLNTSLTVRRGEPNSHQKSGWTQLTDHIISTLSQSRCNVVYMLWGAHAQSKEKFIDSTSNLVLKSVHPSPLSAHRGFMDCHHFSKANDYLTASGLEPINW